VESLQLEIKLILPHLKENSPSGILQADLPERFMLFAFSRNEPGKVQITLQAGEVISGSISTHQGVLLQHKQQVLRVLEQAGMLSWQLILAVDPQEFPHPQTNPQPPDQDSSGSLLLASSIPYRSRQIGLEYFADLLARRVYLLIDGRRSIERIALLAHVTPDYAIELLQYLREQGIVDLVKQR
jgi:hypothetical protein